MADVRRGCAILLLALPIACQNLAWNPRAIPDCSGTLVPSERIEGEFLLRQHLRVTAGTEVFSMELALQKRGDELVLVGFHPLGAKLFTARQVGKEVAVEAHPAPALEVPPENVLRDMHRVHFLRLTPPVTDGIVRGRREERPILEDWKAGELRERIIRQADDSEISTRIEFSTDPATGEATASLDVVACGYRSEIRTLSRRDLP